MPGAQSIDGLVSNLDTSSIVNAIITAERGNIALLEARQADATNQLTTYNSISALMVALRTSIAPLLRASAYETASVSVSNEDAVSVSTTGTVTSGTYSLAVNQLALNHQIASQGFDDPTASLGTGNIQIAVGSGSAHTIVLDSGNNTLLGLKNAINAAGIGVTASIINDGSSSNPYRLLLSSNATGKANMLSVTPSLTGGTAPNFATSSFDAPETLGAFSGTSAVTLGTGASYTGAQNKTFTFTVAGSGSQTIGGGDITLNWTDGTNSGSIVVSAADTEVALTGTGADGLTLSFAAGTLVAGEEFQVQTFTPLLQQAQDAKVSLGSLDGGGSPVVLTSATNELSDLVGGLSITLKSTTLSPVVITASLNKEAIKSNITTLLDQYNEVMRAIDKQFTYNTETEEAGILLGDQFLLQLQSGLRTQMQGAINGLPKSLNMLRSIGIQTAGNGLMSLVDSSKLNSFLDSNLDGVKNLFVDSGVTSNSLIDFVSGTVDTAETTTGYDIDITQAATKMVLQGASIASPSVTPLTLTSSNNVLRLTVDGVASGDLVLTAKEYTSGTALAAEIQTKINADDAIGERGVVVEWVSNGSDGYLKFTSGSYGSASTVSVVTDSSSGAQALGLSAGTQVIAGKDVAGTINGETATGIGRFLTGDSDNETTAGLKLEVRLSTADVIAGVDGTITFSRGFASRLDRVVDSMSRSVDGSIARRTSGLQRQIDDLKAQIEDQEERLEVRRDKLYQRFIELETALSQFQTQSAFLDQQLSNLSANTRTILGNS